MFEWSMWSMNLLYIYPIGVLIMMIYMSYVAAQSTTYIEEPIKGVIFLSFLWPLMLPVMLLVAFIKILIKKFTPGGK